MNQKEWTIMIYMAGDNNLAVDMAYAMEQIKGVAASGADSPNLFVYYDGNSPAIPTLYCDFSEPGKARYVRSYTVPNKTYHVPKKENENAANPRSILNFVDWCVNKVEVENNGEITFGRRAQKYALIFSGHSLGFQDIGLFKDETSGKSMKMSDFYDMLHGLVSNKHDLQELAQSNNWLDDDQQVENELLGQKLDILGFDSCVMGMLEVGYQFNLVAKTMIASEGSVPSAGWTYAKILGCLGREHNRNLDTRSVAELFVKEFIHSQDSYTVGGVSVDMAAWDLGRFNRLADAFDELAEALIECFKDPKSRTYRQMERAILHVHWKCQSYMYDQNVDLGDFCELLDQECGLIVDELGDGDDTHLLKRVQKECRDVLKELQKAVILAGFSGGGYQYSNGVSVFFPWSRDAYEVSRKNYETLWFAKDVKRERLSWTDFLRTYLYQVSLRRFEAPLHDAPAGSKYRYYSGVTFDESPRAVMTGGSGIVSTKIAGQEGTRIAGQEGTRIAGQEGTRIAGQEGTRLAGGGGFFQSMHLFKNVESRWDVSGFTRKPDETEVADRPLISNAKAGSTTK
jgi:cysteine peptidase C11 family protein